MELRPLPPNKNVIEVFGDFLAYLFKCAKNFIVESHPNGPSLWQSLGDNIDIVLSHPNGWEGAQQDRMRQAAVQAGLVPATPAGRARLSFVTEGEASIQYCVSLGMASGSLAVSAFIPRFTNSITDSTLVGRINCHASRCRRWNRRSQHVSLHLNITYRVGGDCAHRL